MPDLKTALQSALLKDEINQWDNEEKQRMQPQNRQAVSTIPGKTVFGVTNNVARECFASVKNNPGLTSTQHNVLLKKKGFKTSSTTSILSQLVKQGQVRKDADRRLYTIVSEYHPLKTTKTPVSQKKPQAPQKKVGNSHQSSVGIAALGADGGKKPKAWAPDEVVNNLNVVQARQLYDYLKKLFGG